MIAIAPPTHAWVDQDAVELDELVAEPLLLREPTSGTRRVLLSALAAHVTSVGDLDFVMEASNAEVIVAAVANGLGVSVVSRLSAGFALEAGRVRPIALHGGVLRRSICLWRRAATPPTRPAELFWGFVNEPDSADLLPR